MRARPEPGGLPGAASYPALDRAASVALLAWPALLVAVTIATRAPQPLVPLVAWLGIAAADARGRARGQRLIAPARVQAGRLAVSVALTLLDAIAVFVAALAMTIVQTVPALGARVVALAAATGATWALLRWRRRGTGAPAPTRLVATPFAVAVAITLAAVVALDHFVHFEFELYVAVLLALLALVAVLNVNALRLTADGALARGLATRLAGFAAAWLAVLFVATLELSAFGSYDLLSFRGPTGVHELLPSVRAHVNSHGFRGPERPIAKGPHTLRIAVLGDSASYGWLVREDQTYARRLEARLAGSVPGHDVEVLNAAVPGYDLRRMLVRYEEHVAAHDPDVVVIVTGANDAGESSADFAAALRAAVDRIRRDGVAVVLCGYPFGPTGRADRGWMVRAARQVAEEEDVTFVDLDATARALGADFVQPDGRHPTPAGHAAIAEALVAPLRAVLTGRP